LIPNCILPLFSSLFSIFLFHMHFFFLFLPFFLYSFVPTSNFQSLLGSLHCAVCLFSTFLLTFYSFLAPSVFALERYFSHKFRSSSQHDTE
jgi:hypothetical protein